MSIEGHFEKEESDIVNLKAARGHIERAGWVNVGVHAIHVELDSKGNLKLTLHPRCAEGTDLGTITQTRDASEAADGVDPDADEADFDPDAE